MQQLHLICGSNDLKQPITQYVFLTKEEVIATDTFCAVVHKTKDLFSEEFVDNIKEGNKFLIHKDIWEEISKPNIVSIELKENQITTTDKKNLLKSFIIEKEDKIGKYPNVKAVIPDENNIDNLCNIVGIAPTILHKLQLAIYPTKPSKNSIFALYMYFSGEDEGKASGAIKVKADKSVYDKDFKAVIMPHL